MSDRFRVRVSVLSHELDFPAHVASAVYLHYSQHARSECLRAVGGDQGQLIASRGGLVNLEETIRYHSELRGGDEVNISCAFAWRDAKALRVHQEFRRPDGSLVAEAAKVGGLLDPQQRRLVAESRRTLAGRGQLPGGVRTLTGLPRRAPAHRPACGSPSGQISGPWGCQMSVSSAPQSTSATSRRHALSSDRFRSRSATRPAAVPTAGRRQDRRAHHRPPATA